MQPIKQAHRVYNLQSFLCSFHSIRFHLDQSIHIGKPNHLISLCRETDCFLCSFDFLLFYFHCICFHLDKAIQTQQPQILIFWCRGTDWSPFCFLNYIWLPSIWTRPSKHDKLRHSYSYAAGRICHHFCWFPFFCFYFVLHAICFHLAKAIHILQTLKLIFGCRGTDL